MGPEANGMVEKTFDPLTIEVERPRLVNCPNCGCSRVHNNGQKGNIRYMTCDDCVNPTTKKPTSFKVVIVGPR